MNRMGIPGQGGPSSEPDRSEGAGWRLVFSIVTSGGLLTFYFLWVTNVGPAYTPLQNIIVLAMSMILYIAVNGVIWLTWAWAGSDWKTLASIVIVMAWLMLVLYWIGFVNSALPPAQSLAALCLGSLVFLSIAAALWILGGASRGEL